MTDEEFELKMDKMLNGLVNAGPKSYKHRKEGEDPKIKKTVKVSIVCTCMFFFVLFFPVFESLAPSVYIFSFL
jgi:hypothetical protein